MPGTGAAVASSSSKPATAAAAAAIVTKSREPDPENKDKKKVKKTSSNKTKSTKSSSSKTTTKKPSSKSKPKSKVATSTTIIDKADDVSEVVEEKKSAHSGASVPAIAKVKTVAMSCGCCKSFVKVPAGTAKFICLQCKVINFTNREESMEDIKAMYQSLDWMQFTVEIGCPRCHSATWIPKKALIFVCYECGCIGDADGHRLGIMRNGSRTHAAVFGLSKHMLSTPWLFWPFFFKSAIDGSK